MGTVNETKIITINDTYSHGNGVTKKTSIFDAEEEEICVYDESGNCLGVLDHSSKSVPSPTLCR